MKRLPEIKSYISSLYRTKMPFLFLETIKRVLDKLRVRFFFYDTFFLVRNHALINRFGSVMSQFIAFSPLWQLLPFPVFGHTFLPQACKWPASYSGQKTNWSGSFPVPNETETHQQNMCHKEIKKILNIWLLVFFLIGTVIDCKIDRDSSIIHLVVNEFSFLGAN